MAQEMEITDNKDGTYTVKSESGKTYTVKRCPDYDGGPEGNLPWECSCPAGTYRGTCKHIVEVRRSTGYLDGIDAEEAKE